MKFRVIAVCACALVLSFAASPAGSLIAAPQSDCVEVTISNSTSTTGATVLPGGSIGLYGTFRNCSNRKVAFSYDLSAMSSCGQKVVIASGKKRLGGDEVTMWTASYMFPLETCGGEWVATMEVSGRGTRGMMDRASTTAMIAE